MRDLDAAGIRDPQLRRSYACCRQLNAAHGRTYYLATLLLPVWKRPYVHALYGFARYADEIVDDLDSTLTDEQKAQQLRGFGQRFLAALREGRRLDEAEAAGATSAEAATPVGRAAAPAGPALKLALAGLDNRKAEVSVLPAIIDTARRWGIDTKHFEAFLTSMEMDLTVTGYATWEDLATYIYGSAAVIGLQMVPILEPSSDAALPYARDLGTAFQLANFIRDVGEDLRRGRVYLPQTSLDLFGVTREHLASGVVDGSVRRMLAFEIARARELFRSAEPGIRLLHPTSRDCIRTAHRLYSGILDEVERADYQVLDRRVAVGMPRRIAVAGPALFHASRVRRSFPSPVVTH